jgi:hypothetical protein
LGAHAIRATGLFVTNSTPRFLLLLDGYASIRHNVDDEIPLYDDDLSPSLVAPLRRPTSTPWLMIVGKLAIKKGP